MPSDYEILRRRGWWFIILAFIFLCASFALAPLGSFFIWISAGGTVYCVFYSIYNFVIAKPTYVTQHRGRQRKETEKEREMREYIRKHVTILISMMLGALLLVVIYWVFFA